MDKTLFMQRMEELCDIELHLGAHTDWEHGHCTMEVAAWLAGETHSDRPKCADPDIGQLARCLNDSIAGDAARTAALRPFVPRIVGTRTDDPNIRQRRSELHWELAAAQQSCTTQEQSLRLGLETLDKMIALTEAPKEDEA